MENVISFFSRIRTRDTEDMPVEQRANGTNGVPAATENASTTSSAPAPVSLPLRKDFGGIASRNAENEERLRRERAQANKNVLKSYRIK